MITKEQFLKAMLYLGTAYNKPIEKGTIQIWYEYFKDANYNVLMRAIKNIVATNKFMPTLAELIEECKKVDNKVAVSIIDKMYNERYFHQCAVGEQSDAEAFQDYIKIQGFVTAGIIPEWLLKDMMEYGYTKPTTYLPGQAVSEPQLYLTE